MNKKIKVINLLKNVANGIKIPKTIYFMSYKYNLQNDEKRKGYYRSVYDSNYIALTTDFTILDILNDYVEYEDERDFEATPKEQRAKC